MPYNSSEPGNEATTVLTQMTDHRRRLLAPARRRAQGRCPKPETDHATGNQQCSAAAGDGDDQTIYGFNGADPEAAVLSCRG